MHPDQAGSISVTVFARLSKSPVGVTHQPVCWYPGTGITLLAPNSTQNWCSIVYVVYISQNLKGPTCSARWRQLCALLSLTNTRRRCRTMAPDGRDDGTSCACKGVRRCLVCEKLKGKVQLETSEPKVLISDRELCFVMF